MENKVLNSGILPLNKSIDGISIIYSRQGRVSLVMIQIPSSESYTA